MWKKAYLAIFVLLLSAFSVYSYAELTMDAASNKVTQIIYMHDSVSYTAAKSKIFNSSDIKDDEYLKNLSSGEVVGLISVTTQGVMLLV